ncbi:MAG TPA: hypothetical protein VFG83_16845 [Kofleriaceae bacterium]|nr:hypothetical protein [Kofleriaceae bacterium]
MIRLPRTGDSPLALPDTAELIAETSTDTRDGFRYHEIRVYRIGDRLAAHIGYRTRWDGEVGHDTAEVLGGPQELRELLLGYNPLAWYVGPPDGVKRGRERREAEMRALRLRWEHAVSVVLERWPEVVEAAG